MAGSSGVKKSGLSFVAWASKAIGVLAFCEANIHWRIFLECLQKNLQKKDILIDHNKIVVSSL